MNLSRKELKLPHNDNSNSDCTLYTIGFAKKSAKQFFTLLKDNGVKTLIDVRLNNVSQLAGFTKKKDLHYFLKEICDINYDHRPEFAPTKEILDAYKKKEISWSDYESKYNSVLIERSVAKQITSEELNMACLLCSEPTAEKCHRRLLAEAFKKHYGDINIKHI